MSNRVVVLARQAGNRFLGSLKLFTNSGSGILVRFFSALYL
jgi:hypothetical protein